MQEQKTTNSVFASVFAHLRANLWLLLLTVVICCVLYPAAVWAVGQLFFHNAAQGSLVDANGNPTSDEKAAVGSKLIAQSFNSAWFFQARPSAASYNAAASGGSNFGASNPKLRGRVAQLLGTISRYSDAYKKAHPVPATDPKQAPGDPNPQDDIKAWFHQQTDPIQNYILQWAKDHPDVVAAWKKDNPDSPKTLGADDAAKALTTDDLAVYFAKSFAKEHADAWPAIDADTGVVKPAPTDKVSFGPFADWAGANSTLAGAWATGTPSIKDYILQWAKDHPEVVAAWKKDNPTATTDPGADAMVAYFFKSYATEHPGKWPTVESPGDVTTKITGWAKDHPEVVKKWKEANPDATDEPKDVDLVAFFYADYPKNPKDWPPLAPGEWVDADPVKAVVKPDAADSDVESTFFDTWLTAQVQAQKLDPLKDFVQVPADMVTASGSGLDPDVSLKNAEYQKETVVQGAVDHIVQQFEDNEDNKKANRKATDEQKAKIKDQIGKVVDKLLGELPYRPMFGLTGDAPLVNVLQLNLRLQAETAKVQVQ